MESSASTLASTATLFRKAGWTETAALLALAWFVPFVVHVAPWSGTPPLGAYLLPMFWATFVATYFYGVRVGGVAGLVAPLANLLVTGLPAWRFVATTSIELIAFAIFVAMALRWLPRFVLLAPLGYLVARFVLVGVEMVLPVVGGSDEPLGAFLGSLRTGFAGLVVLTAINCALVVFYAKPRRRAS